MKFPLEHSGVLSFQPGIALCFGITETATGYEAPEERRGQAQAFGTKGS
jgi:hypothetical protein